MVALPLVFRLEVENNTKTDWIVPTGFCSILLRGAQLIDFHQITMLSATTFDFLTQKITPHISGVISL